MEGDFGVHDHLPPVREMHDHVRPPQPFVGAHALLFTEVAMLAHAGELRGSAQLDLPPTAADLGRAQGVHQARGLGRQLVVLGAQATELGRQGRRLFCPNLRQCSLLGPELVQGILHWPHEIRDRLFSALEAAIGALDQLAQPCLGHCEKLFVGPLQGLPRQGLKAVPQMS